MPMILSIAQGITAIHQYGDSLYASAKDTAHVAIRRICCMDFFISLARRTSWLIGSRTVTIRCSSLLCSSITVRLFPCVAAFVPSSHLFHPKTLAQSS